MSARTPMSELLMTRAEFVRTHVPTKCLPLPGERWERYVSRVWPSVAAALELEDDEERVAALDKLNGLDWASALIYDLCVSLRRRNDARDGENDNDDD